MQRRRLRQRPVHLRRQRRHRLVAPGHGKVAGKEPLATRRRYFAKLWENVQKGIDAKQSAEEVAAGFETAWYGKPAKQNGDNVRHVNGEMTGKNDPAK